LKRRHTLLCCLFLVVCSGTAAQQNDPGGGAEVRSNPLPLRTTLVYECNGYGFIARRGASEMALWLKDGYVVLPQAADDSGTVYEDGDVSFWTSGDEAMLTVDGQNYQNCHLNPVRVPWEDARLRGVSFRAVGNEPGWYLEIQESRLLFVGQYATTRILVPDAIAEGTSQVRAYRVTAGAQQLRVDIVDEACVDNMSGESFPSRVTVTLDGTSFQGCGQALDSPSEDVD